MRMFCNLFQLLLFLVCIGCDSIGAAAADSEPKLDRAFNDAVDIYIKHAQKSAGFENIDIQWHSNLAVLVKSKNRQAAQMLARLGTFDLDGALGEDYTCASSLHPKEVATQLAVDNNAGFCHQVLAARHVENSGICASEATIRRRIESMKSQPSSNGEAECNF